MPRNRGKSDKAEEANLKKLHAAIVANDVTQVRSLLEKFGNHHRTTWYYGVGSPIHSAAGFGKIDILKVLIDEGFDVNAYLEMNSNNGIPGLIWAIMHNRAQSVELLLASGADVSLKGSWHGTQGNAMAFATKRKNEAILELLRSHESKAKTKSKYFNLYHTQGGFA